MKDRFLKNSHHAKFYGIIKGVYHTPTQLTMTVNNTSPSHNNSSLKFLEKSPNTIKQLNSSKSSRTFYKIAPNPLEPPKNSSYKSRTKAPDRPEILSNFCAPNSMKISFCSPLQPREGWIAGSGYIHPRRAQVDHKRSLTPMASCSS